MLKKLLLILVIIEISFTISPFPFRRINKINNDISSITSNADYQTKYYTSQLLDHFNYNDTRTYSQRYLEKTPSNWTQANPIFVYCGNEGDIVGFYENSGFLTNTLYNLFTAKILFVEHRFFGVSMPFGNQTYTNTSNLAYLTVTQAMADLVQFIKHYNRDILQCQPQNCPKYVSFGGSYGAMLASWMRMKFPNVFYASIASSAPILLFKGRSNPEGYSIICTRDYNYTTAVPNCVNLMREAYQRLENYRTASNLSSSVKSTLNSAFNLCSNSYITQPQDIMSLENWLLGAHQTMPMVNYPYPAALVGSLPGWPCNVSCTAFSAYASVQNVSSISDQNLFKAFYNSANFFYNYQQTPTCLNLYPNTTTIDTGDLGWECLACGMCPMPMTSKFDSVDMFPPAPWNYESYTLSCKQAFNIYPRYDWALDYFGGRTDASLLSYTKIFFANGKLDPWSSGGVLSTLSPDLPAYYMDGAAHHLDLRLPNPADPQGVITGRNLEIYYLKKWLNITSSDGRFDFVYQGLAEMDQNELKQVLGTEESVSEEQIEILMPHNGFLSKQ